jgi:hypothetical protein
MKQFSDRVWKAVFLVAAIWNIYFSITAIIMRDFNMQVYFGEEAATVLSGNYYAVVFYNLLWAAVLVFGIGFYIVSRDVNRNQGIVLLAIIGKLCFLVYYAVMYATSKCTIWGLLGVMADNVFTVLFAYFLIQKRQAPGK